ncbi:hypothetical protein KIPB_000089 [Kipferlia bialata]|uniref:Uncharacterized protein n=1 Tax=Kipferlia bialata TaxID=797122 RepID=A0A9K3CPX0_9EUKA|nr:hypothetical protein KIPB_000089 [Kipferlia bialata]|eukprot:g89.t1
MTFGYLNSAKMMAPSSPSSRPRSPFLAPLAPFLSVFLRYLACLPLMMFLQSWVTIHDKMLDSWAKGVEYTFEWEYLCRAGPINLLGLCFVLFAPVLYVCGVVYHRRSARVERESATVDAPAQDDVSGDVPACPSEADIRVRVRTLHQCSQVLMVVAIVACLPTRPIQRAITSHYNVDSMEALAHSTHSLWSAVGVELLEMLAGYNEGLFPFLTPALAGLAMGIRLQAAALSNTLPIDPTREVGEGLAVELWWALVMLVLGLVACVYEVVVDGWAFDPEVDFRDPGVTVTWLQTAVQIAGVALCQKWTDNAKDLTHTVAWSSHLRIWSTYSLTVYTLNMVVSIPVRIMFSPFSDKCDFVYRYSCYNYGLVFIEFIAAGAAWYGVLRLWDVLKGYGSPDFLLSTIGRAIQALVGGGQFSLPQIAACHGAVTPVTPWRKVPADVEQVETVDGSVVEGVPQEVC